MDLIDLERYKRIGGVGKVKLDSQFRITENNIKEFAQFRDCFQQYSSAEDLLGKWVSVEAFGRAFSKHASSHFNKQSGVLAVRDDKGVQDPDTFAQDVIAEVKSKYARYVPGIPASKDVKMPSKYECVRMEDIEGVLGTYYSIGIKNVSDPTIEAVDKQASRNVPGRDPFTNNTVDKHPFTSSVPTTKPLPSVYLQKFRQWYMSGGQTPLTDKEKAMFVKALEIFRQKYAEGKRGEKFEDALRKIIHKDDSSLENFFGKIFHESGMSFDKWLETLIPEQELTVKRTKGVFYKPKDGDYISVEEFRFALLRYFNQIEKDNIILKVIKKDKGVINAEELVDDIVKAISNNGKIKVQNKTTVSDPKKPTMESLFPEKVQLPNGQFVHLKELIGSMKNYLVLEKDKPLPTPPGLEDPRKLTLFIDWLRGVKDELDFALIGLFNKALAWLRMQWEKTNAKDPDQTRKTFEGWIKNWMSEKDPRQPKNKGKKKGRTTPSGYEYPGEMPEIDPEDPEVSPIGRGGRDPKKKRPKGDPWGLEEPAEDPTDPQKKIPIGGTGGVGEPTEDPTDPSRKTPTGGTGGVGEPTENPTSEQENPETLRVVRIDKQVATKAAALVLAAVLAVGGLVSGFNLKEVEVPNGSHKISTFDHNNLNYSLNLINETNREVPPTLDEITAYILSEIEKGGNVALGDYLAVKEGDLFHEMASTNAKFGVFGETHPAGFYGVTGLALSDGEKIVYIENFKAEDIEMNLGDLARQAIDKGLDWQKIKIFWHAGSKNLPVLNENGEEGRNWRAGWVELDGHSFNEMPGSKIQVDISKKQVSGTVDNFTGSVVTIDGQEYKVLDESGKPLPAGSYVNPQGKPYDINSVSIEEVTKESTVTDTKTVKKLSFSISGLVFGVGLGIALLMAVELTRRKINKKLKDDPSFIALGDAVSYEDFKRDFELTAKEMGIVVDEKTVNKEYETYLLQTLSYMSRSLNLFERTMVSKVYKMKSYCVELTEADKVLIEEVAILTAQRSDELGFNPETDEISIQGSRRNENGHMVGNLQIIVNYNAKPSKDGVQGPQRSKNITELVMKQIKKVGEKNPISAIDPDTMKKAEILRRSLEGTPKSMGEE